MEKSKGRNCLQMSVTSTVISIKKDSILKTKAKESMNNIQYFFHHLSTNTAKVVSECVK